LPDSTFYVTQELSRVVFEHLPLGIVIIDAQGVIVMANGGLEQMLGYHTDELVGQRIELLLPDRYARSHSAARLDYLAHAQARPMGVGRELTARHRDGHEIPVEIGLNPVTVGEGQFVISTLVDVTERRQLEHQLLQAQKQEVIGNLASGIAHDFNNILLGILGYTELAKVAARDVSDVWTNLDVVIETTHRGRDLVDHILTFARNGEPHRRSVNWKSVLKDGVKLMRPSLPPNVDICVQGDSVVPDVLADPVELQQIFMNLVMNAVHAVKQDGGVVDVRVAEVQREPSLAARPDKLAEMQVRLSVIDNGVGMTPDVLNRVFEPFFTTKSPGEGTGLGMFVVQRVVSNLGGTVAVESSEDKGTRVDVYLPVSSNSDGKPRKSAAASQSASRATASAT
jgi:PAS domain S-box-containing protein